MMKCYLLSIIVCTHNRSRLLNKCLESLLAQNVNSIEIVVIDNNSQDDTAQIVNKYTIEHQNIRYFCETEIGLSHARNRGIMESTSEWVLYIDDDGIAFPNFVQRALYLIDRGDYDCVGGVYNGYYEDKKPRWVNDEYGSSKIISDNLVPCKFDVPTGGVVLYRKQSINSVGKFRVDLGMIGNHNFIGEETELQYRLEKKGFRIGSDPHLKIWHLINPQYLKLSYPIKKAFNGGKYWAKTIYPKRKWNLFAQLICSIIIGLIYTFPKSLIKLFFQKNYYLENLLFDLIIPTIRIFGKLS